MTDEKTEEAAKQPPTPITPEETEYVEAALKSGTMNVNEIRMVVLCARIRGVAPMEFQSEWMDIRVGIQQVFRKLGLSHGIIQA